MKTNQQTRFNWTGSVILGMTFLVFALPGYARYAGDVQRIVVMPFVATAPDAPEALHAQVMEGLRLTLATSPGVEIIEYDPTSSLVKRAMTQAKGSERERLVESMAELTISTTAPEQRQRAAAIIADALSVDAVVYGTYDQYEFTAPPDSYQSKLRLQAVKVSADAEGEGVAETMTLIGRSVAVARPSVQKSMHDAKASADLATKLVAYLVADDAVTLAQLDEANQAPMPAKPRAVDGTWRWFAALGAVVVGALSVGL